ncbi:MAG: hypothetical protein ABIH71_01150 [Candidatus Omnitrophota bacterium]|nr:hypothetical protein [Candidatus Omnitrophota bacterium]
MSVIIRKLFKHGGSYAVDIPMAFVKCAGGKEVVLESTPRRISIRPKIKLDTLEEEPLFGEFLHALTIDALKHPERLYGVKEVWDKDWDKLLKNVKSDEE